MDETHTASNDLCESCRTIPSLRELSNNYYTLHDTFQEFQSCRCHFCHWLYTYIDSKPEYREVFKELAEDNSAVELFGNMMFPKENEGFQSLGLNTSSVMLYLFARRGELNYICVIAVVPANVGQIIQLPSIYGEDSLITTRLLMRQSTS